MQATLCCQCQNPIPEKKLRWKHTKYCSQDCQKKAFRLEGASAKYCKLSTGSVGALHELMVACDLMKRGFAVFRALSPTCACDLLVLTPQGVLMRVEVTTGYINKSGNVSFPAHKKENFDVAAVVTGVGIRYFPEIEAPIPMPV